MKIQASQRMAIVEAAGFEQMSKEQQKKYLEKHPNSKYAKGGKPSSKPAGKPFAKGPKHAEYEYDDLGYNLHPDDAEAFHKLPQKKKDKIVDAWKDGYGAKHAFQEHR